MSRPSDKTLSLWFLELSDALSSGFDAVEAISMSDGIPKSTRANLLERFHVGSSWSDAIAELEELLQPGEASIIAAAEQSGTLPEAFKELGEARKESAALKTRMLLMSLYPLGVLHFGVLVFPATHLLEGRVEAYAVSVGMFLVPFWSVALTLFLAFRYFPAFKKRFQVCFPFIRGYTIYRDLARFSRVFSICLRSGLPVGECWKLGLEAAHSWRLKKEGEGAVRAIASGLPASEAFVEKGGFPKELKQLYRIGERSGSLDENMERAAELYSGKAKSRVMVAALFYSQLLLGGVALFVAVKVISFYRGYFDEILKIME